MLAQFIDAYRINNKVVLWLKTKNKNIRYEVDHVSFIYLEYNDIARNFLSKYSIEFQICHKLTYYGNWKKVYQIVVPNLEKFESYISWIEKCANYELTLYNADITPELGFIFDNKLVPFESVIIEDKVYKFDYDYEINLSQVNIELFLTNKIEKINFNNELIIGDEEVILKTFINRFHLFDPDIVVMQNAFFSLPKLVERLSIYGLKCKFNRFDDYDIKYKGGKPFYTYGVVRYKHFGIRLRGRLLIDSASTVGEECDVQSVIEMCQLSSCLFQKVGSRSFGATFQAALIREMYYNNYLIPYKEKPLDPTMNLFERLKSDRAGHTMDPLVGFHKDVAEIDFSSMFPWIIYNENISADTILNSKPPLKKVPGIPVNISFSKRGIIPRAIKPFIDRRMYYKNNPSRINKQKAVGLKWVLVTSYGYLRFREFKLGIACSHQAVCAYAREIILEAKNLAELRGFRIIHGVVDSLYIQKKGITEEEVLDFCKELELLTRIPVSFEGLFKWIVFLPSVNNDYRPVPTKYYGAFRNGDLKKRGIEVRQRATPFVVKYFQEKCLELMQNCDSEEEIVKLLPKFRNLLNEIVNLIPTMDSKWLKIKLRISRETYKHNIPQKIIKEKLKKKGIEVQPGQKIEFCYDVKGIVLCEELTFADLKKYRSLLERALFTLLQPFGIKKNNLLDTQVSLKEYIVSKIYETVY